MYCTDSPGEGLAQNMMRMYKDEKIRTELIEKQHIISKKWHPEPVAEQLLDLCISFI
jgi:hypothetical protein